MRQTIKERKEEIKLSPEAVDRISEWTAEALAEGGTDSTEILRLRLAAEELLSFWMKRLGEGSRCTFLAGSRLRRNYIEIKVSGEKLDPAQMNDGEEDGEAYGDFLYSSLLAQTKLAPVYDYRDGVNRIMINPPRKLKMGQISQVLLAIAAAIVLGLCSRLLPEGVRTGVNSGVTPLFDTMVGALRMLSSPMIFLTICRGIVSIGDITLLGKIGRAVIGRMMSLTAVITAALCIVLMGRGCLLWEEVFRPATRGPPPRFMLCCWILSPKILYRLFRKEMLFRSFLWESAWGLRC